MNQKIKFIKNTFYEDNRSNKMDDTYLIDSNVLIRLRDLFYNPQKLDDEHSCEYLDFAQRLTYDNVYFISALLECAWDFEKCALDNNKMNRYLVMLDNILGADSNTFSRIRNKEKHDDNSVIKNPKRDFTSLINNCKSSKKVLPSVCLISRYAQLSKLGISLKELYQKLEYYSLKEIGLIGSYEWLCILTLMFSNENEIKNKIKQMLKLNRENVSKHDIYNGCWDMYRIRELNVFGLYSSITCNWRVFKTQY